MDDEHLLFGITPEEWAQTPASVRTGFLTLVDMVKELSARVKTLEAQVKQTSRNSSKPPSSDPPSAPLPPARVPRGKKRGAQTGHPDQQRPFVPPEQVDEVVELRPTLCPSCHSELSADLPLAEPTFCSQVWELPPLKAIVSEYQQHSVVCPCCKLLVTAELPQDMPPGAFGPRLSALSALLHGSYRLSIRETVRFLNEVFAVAICSGSVIASCQRLSHSLEPIYRTIERRVQDQPRVWVDETSWHEQTKQVWLWVAESQEATLFRIDTSRSQKARKRLLGEWYDGIVHSDRAKAYDDLPKRQRQLCWAHLERNFRGLADQEEAERWCALELLAQVRALWQGWRGYKCGVFDRIALDQALVGVRAEIRWLLEWGKQSRWDKLREMCEGVLRSWEALWAFCRVEGLEPTNNRAERAVRPAVVWRKSCFGTQSEQGSRFVERVLSVRASCAHQGKPLFPFLVAALQADWAKTPPPLLFPTP